MNFWRTSVCEEDLNELLKDSLVELWKVARDKSTSEASWWEAWHEEWEPAQKALFSKYSEFAHEGSILIGEKWHGVQEYNVQVWDLSWKLFENCLWKQIIWMIQNMKGKSCELSNVAAEKHK